MIGWVERLCGDLCYDYYSLYNLNPVCHTNNNHRFDFVGAKFHCPHALADGNQHIQIREKTLEFSSRVLSTLSSYLLVAKTTATTTPVFAGQPW